MKLFICDYYNWLVFANTSISVNLDLIKVFDSCSLIIRLFKATSILYPFIHTPPTAPNTSIKAGMWHFMRGSVKFGLFRLS